ncbi:hypothetical protein OG320_06410 [Microbispora sp. NBC_01189]|uniref:hypothetical protein n=1 Tax=Microbispora sp. NBC_01189 TaxID=2903583 RepID=UPI002E1563ED|nr:hypothetical protein OG320_06410 [Microbispora sp. NBC_01189]
MTEEVDRRVLLERWITLVEEDLESEIHPIGPAERRRKEALVREYRRELGELSS